MIKSFKHKGLQEFFETGSLKGIQAIHAKKIRSILVALNIMKNLEPLQAPSYKLHPLKGDLKGLWSITVQANWRITFKFEDENVYIVDYQDYH
jgi:proteic killer suppression protein